MLCQNYENRKTTPTTSSDPVPIHEAPTYTLKSLTSCSTVNVQEIHPLQLTNRRPIPDKTKEGSMSAAD